MSEASVIIEGNLMYFPELDKYDMFDMYPHFPNVEVS